MSKKTFARDRKPREESSNVFPLERLTPEFLSELLAKLKEGQSIELFQGGRVVYHDKGSGQNFDLKNALFVRPEVERFRSTGNVIPVDEPHNYREKNKATRKAINRNEKKIKGTTIGLLIQIAVDNIPFTVVKTDSGTYDQYEVGDIIVRCPMGDTNRIVMYKPPREDWIYPANED